MTNQEKKQKLWKDTIYPKVKHLETFCEIKTIGIDDGSVYFHPEFILDENTYLRGQCDIKAHYIYAINMVFKNETNTTSIEIFDGMLDDVITGLYANRENVLFALETYKKVKDHINSLKNYADDYIINIIKENSLNELTQSFVNELKNTTYLLEQLKKIRQ